MKRLILAAMPLALLLGCSKATDTPSERPGQPATPQLPATVAFDRDLVEIDCASDRSTGRFTATLKREGEYLPDTVYTLSSRDPLGVLSFEPRLHFGLDDTQARFDVTYDIVLEPGTSYSAVVSIEDKSLAVSFIRPSDHGEAVSGTYASGSHTFRMSGRAYAFDGGVRYELARADGVAFARTFTHYSDGRVSVTPGEAQVDGFERFEPTQIQQDTDMPIYWLASMHHPDEGYYSLCLTYTGADGCEPRYDVFRLDSEQSAQWRRLPDAFIEDGWLVGVISFRLEMPPKPSDVPWPVEAWQNAEDPDLLRLAGIYRVASPLSALNSEDAMTPVDIVLNRRDNTAAITRTYSGFANADVFAASFEMGGNGTFTTTGAGTVIIDIPLPCHTGYGTYGTWNNPYPAKITFTSVE